MTDRTKRSLILVALITFGAFFTTMGLTIVGLIGRAHAQGEVLIAPPEDLFLQLYHFIREGSHLPAVGAGIMLFVWLLRWGHSKFPAPVGPFFTTKLGGYLLGFGTAANVYLGTALIAGQSWTLGLLFQALGTGFAAAGSWDAVKDLLKKDTKTRTAVGTILLVTILISATACRPIKDEIHKVGDDVVDCTVGELSSLGGLVPVLLPAIGPSPDWGLLADQLEQAGSRVGVCVLAMLVDRWKSSLKLATPQGAFEADQALTVFKAKYKIAVVKTNFGAR
jgi:hypothetical protein